MAIKVKPVKAVAPKGSRTFLEKVMAAPGRVDVEKGIIYGVKIIGLHSANGAEYPLDVLTKAVTLYEGAGVFINHPPSKDQAEIRELYDHFGTIINVRPQADGLYGDLLVKKSHDYAQAIMEAAVKQPKEFGLSHNALVKTAGDKPNGVVEEIIRVRSVDLVSNPATTHGLFEEKQMNPEELLVAEEEAAVAAPAASPDEAVKNSFKQAINMLLDDASMSNDEKVAKISELLAASDSAMEALGTGKKEDKQESVDGKIMLELQQLRIRDKARSLLESEGLDKDADLLDALSSMTSEAAMKKLIAKWPRKVVVKKTSVAFEAKDEAPVKVESHEDFMKALRGF